MTQARRSWKIGVPMGRALHHDGSNTRRSLSTTRQKKWGKTRATHEMQSNYGGSTRRQHKAIKSFRVMTL
jgi:hypothetical protein